jgi:WD40 repeat protein
MKFAMKLAEGITVWRFPVFDRLHTIPDDSKDVSLTFLKDGKVLASAGNAQFLKFWDLESGQLIKAFIPEKDIDEYCVSDDGKIIAGTGSDRKIRIWDFESEKELKVIEAHLPKSDRVQSLAFSPNNKMLASVHDTSEEDPKLGTKVKGQIRLWNVLSGELFNSFTETPHIPARLWFTSDSKKIISYDQVTSELTLLDIESGKGVKLSKNDSVNIPASPFEVGNLFVGAQIDSGTKKVIVWMLDTLTFREVRSFTLDTPVISSLSLSQTGNVLVTTGDNAINFWNAFSGEKIARLYMMGNGDWVVVTPESDYDATPGAQKWMHYVDGLKVLPLDSAKDPHFKPGLLSALLK